MERLKLITSLLIIWSVFFASSCSSAELTCDISLIEATLATLYREKNPPEALTMIKPCAEQGDSASQIALSLVYGQDPRDKNYEDLEKALFWSERATVKGGIVALYKHGLAISVLGTSVGMGAIETMFASLDWDLKAAEWGHPCSLYNIGFHLKRYTRDKVAAYTFLTLAERRANPSFHYYEFIDFDLKELRESPEISEEGIAEAIRLADIWERNHPDAAKSWPSDDWVYNMKGEGAKQIPVMTTPPTSKFFCNVFGKIMLYCPQYAERELTEAELKALRPGYVKKH